MRDSPLTILSLVSGNCRGGSDRLALDVAKGLRAHGHRVIWGCTSDCLFTGEAHAAGLEIYILDYSGSMDMKPLPSFMRFCGDEKINVINVHDSHGRHLLVAAKLLGLRKRVVFTRHCISGSTPYVSAFFYNFIVDMNIAVSNAARKGLLRGGISRRKAVTVYGGIDLEKFEKVPPEKIARVREKYGRSGVNIGIVAHLGLHKGRTDKPTMKRHEILFHALARLGGDFSLLVLGPEGETEIESLKVIARDKGLDTDRITFCGFQKDISPFYKIMDLNILPSTNEGLGLAIIEAMAAGVPCIGADSGGIREIITDGVNGFLFKPGDSEDLALKIRMIIENKEMREGFVGRGKEKVRALFTVEKTVLETEKIFYDLLR